MKKSFISTLLVIGLIIGGFVLPGVTESQKPASIVGTWRGYDQTNWSVTLIFKKDMTLRVMLREFTWDTPYKIDYTKDPITIDIDDFEAEEFTGVNERNYRLLETTFLGIVSFSDKGNKMMIEGYNKDKRPKSFTKNALELTRSNE